MRHLSLSSSSLRTRLFLVLAALVAALVAAQWWLVRSLSDDLDRELEHVALAVGTSVASFVSGDLGEIEEIYRVRNHDEGDGKGEGEHRAYSYHWQVDTERKEGEAAEGDTEVLRQTVGEEGEKRKVLVRRFVTEETRSLSPEELAEGVSLDETRRQDVSRVEIELQRDVDDHFLFLSMPELSARLPVPSEGVAERVETFRRRMFLGSGLIFAVGLLLAGVVAHRVSAPLRRLAAAAEEVGGGAFGTRVEASGGSREVRRTVAAFNRMSQRLAELDERARRLASLKHLGEIGDVARGLAHSLRNPLNALGLSVEELAHRAQIDEQHDETTERDAETDAETDALARAARRQIRRIDRGIRSFLVLASPAGGVVDEVDVEALARDVALEALQDAGGRVRVEVRSGDGPAPRLRAVEAELRAVVQALVVNAVEASPDGETVVVGIEPADGGVRLEVADRGPGLAPEVRDRLFTPHVSTKSHGSGMGLFLAHRLATERYGGRLELRGREQGTRAVLELGDRREPEGEAT